MLDTTESRATPSDREYVLIAVLFACAAAHGFLAVSHTFPEDPYPFFRDEAPGDKPGPKQIAYPLGILYVVFVPFHGGHPFWVRHGDRYRVLKQVIDGYPILPRGFHTDVKAIVFNGPLLKSGQGIIECGKTPLSVLWGYPLRRDGCGDEEFLVDIDAAANRMHDPHRHSPPSE
jgi:hypothetical protein